MWGARVTPRLHDGENFITETAITVSSSLLHDYDRCMEIDHITRHTIERLLAAIESRDLRAIRTVLHADVTWQNVPHPPVRGREAVVGLLGNILCWSDKVQWDVVSASVSGDTGWYERLDRFWLDGEEYAVPCNGVLTVDRDTQSIIAMKDYVDLGEWRSRVTPKLASLAARSPAAVVARHLKAVRTLDPVAMAADYALSATLERPGARYSDWYAIADYFASVPERLAGRQLIFSEVEVAGLDAAQVAWEMTGATASVVSGRDLFRVSEGRIFHQVTMLDEGDF